MNFKNAKGLLKNDFKDFIRFYLRASAFICG